SGPLVFVEGVKDVGYGEIAEVETSFGEVRRGRVLIVDEEVAAIQVFEGTSDFSSTKTKVRFTGKPLLAKVSEEMLGRVFDGTGRPLDGKPDLITGEERDINGAPINPVSRVYPENFIQTGISAIDGMNTLIRGQKLPLFSTSGLPHNRLAAQIVRQATIPGEESEFVIVFAAMGVKHDEAAYFEESFRESGALENVVMFLNLADDPSIERTITPRVALTCAEYLAFELEKHVLVILTDMTNYCEALREVATARGDVPTRKGYPGYLYSDLASMYERTGRIKGSRGSITQIPIVTMPNNDMTHPVPDLTGYITEGQVVLAPRLDKEGIYPPIAVLPSLSRLMKDGIGEGFTREDHPNLSNQLYGSYARVQQIRNIASIIGEEELSDVDKRYLEFGEFFERDFLSQGEANRTIEETLDFGWKALGILPVEELGRLKREQIERYYKPRE
ncbi:MAG: V-type ATP synthase subunit B, partial [Candidatus Bipolaricaulia bacterium]